MRKSIVTAILGPTNTGKTYSAFKKLYNYKNGVIGFPLRLLARENYDLARNEFGESNVALITGEEKIIPSDPKYYFCTVESIPENIDFEFVAIDEVQLSADFERGYNFTEKIIKKKGLLETLFLGSNSMEPILKLMYPNINILKKPRLSKLSYCGYKNLSRLPQRSAVIAFSLVDVYEIANKIKQSFGGVSVVMGALSPEVRNAQVKLFEDGKVDHIVATDAIGMGINMDLNNVFFSSIKKFDGKKIRRLRLSEISQIAGRAGRYLNDGSFGITGECGEISPEEIELLETHKIDDINTIFWRNPKLNFKNGDILIKSLEEKPKKNWLKKIAEGEDEKILKYILKDTEKLQIFNNENELKLLWECCQIPDFVKKTYGNHLEVVGKVFNFLRENPGKITNKYMKQQLSMLDKLDGNVDSISNRIANVRTWSYVANKNGWVENQDYWIERAKFLEDKLSDRLHDELTKSFIDKRASVLAKGLKQDIIFETKIVENEKVMINNQFIGNLKGLKLELDFKIGDLDSDIKSLKKADGLVVGSALCKSISDAVNKRKNPAIAAQKTVKKLKTKIL